MKRKEAAARAVAAKNPDELRLSARQAQEISAARDAATAITTRVGMLTRQRVAIEQQIAAGLGELERAEVAYRDRVDKAATLNGIDIDARPEETGETWNFDFATMTFRRMPFVPQQPQQQPQQPQQQASEPSR